MPVIYYGGAGGGGSSDVLIVAETGVSLADITGATGERTMATLTIPEGIMGGDSILQIECYSHQTNNANTKTIRFKIDGDTFGAMSVKSCSGARMQKNLAGNGTPASQISLPSNLNDLASTSGTQQQKTYDFTQPRTLTITGELAVATDSLVVDHYRVAVINPVS